MKLRVALKLYGKVLSGERVRAVTWRRMLTRLAGRYHWYLFVLYGRRAEGGEWEWRVSK